MQNLIHPIANFSESLSGDFASVNSYIDELGNKIQQSSLNPALLAKVDDLVSIINKLQIKLSSPPAHEGSNLTADQSPGPANTPIPVPVVKVFRDSIYKYVADGILKKENLQVQMEFTPKLNDVLDKIDNALLDQSIEYVVVAASTNDLKDSTPQDIVEKILSAY